MSFFAMPYFVYSYKKLLIMLGVFVLGCASSTVKQSTLAEQSFNSQQALPNFKNSQDKAHPLLGQIWDVKRQGWVTPDQLVSRLALNSLVQLAYHQEIEDQRNVLLWLLGQLTAADSLESLALQPLVADEKHFAFNPKQALDSDEKLQTALNWQADALLWQQLAPSIRYAISHDVALLAVEPDQKSLQTILGSSKIMELEKNLGRKGASQLRDKFSTLSCGHKIKSQVYQHLIKDHLAKQFWLANKIEEKKNKHPILIAGDNNIVNKVFGVSAFINKNMQDKSVVLGLVSVKDSIDLTQYADEMAGFDYAWFVPRTVSSSGCRHS